MSKKRDNKRLNKRVADYRKYGWAVPQGWWRIARYKGLI